MSLLNYLQFQEIDEEDDIPKKHRAQDEILLDDQIDEGSLEEFWEKVVEDVRKDPDWFTFAEE